jgi:hypothetical protein
MRADHKWLGVLAVAVGMMGCSSSDKRATSVATGSTAPVTSPSGTLATTRSSEVTTIAETTATVSPADVITRPYVDPAVCGNGAKTEFRGQDLTLLPFALGREQPIPLQVLAAPTDGVAKPFAVVVRLSAGSRDVSEDHHVQINGIEVGVTEVANGNAAAAWTLPDGTKGYMRARDLDEAALITLVTRLTPRDPDAPIPGFDLKPSSDPNAPVLLHEHLNTGLSGTVTRFECDTGFNEGRNRIAVISGDPVFVYFGIIDRPRPYAVGSNGDGAITITNSITQTITIQDITETEPATWAALPSIQQP